MRRIVVAHYVLFTLGAVLAFGQSKTTAVLSGTISDPTEANVPGAKVVATNTQTGANLEAASDDRGEYRFPLLPPGSYDVKVEKQGFAAQIQRNIEVTVGQAAVLDFKLAVGATTQVVEVATGVLLVETERTQQANTIEQEEVRNLPINRRDYLTFALLAPGVVDSKGLADANSFRVKQTPDSGLSFYGSNGRGNNISVDGGETNDAAHNTQEDMIANLSGAAGEDKGYWIKASVAADGRFTVTNSRNNFSKTYTAR